MVRLRIIAVLCGVMIATGIVVGQARAERFDLPLPTWKLSQDLMSYAKAGESDMIRQIMPMIRPMIRALGDQYGSDVQYEIERSLGSGNVAEMVSAVERLLAMDIRDLMGEAAASVRGKEAKAITQMKSAYLSYQVIGPELERSRFSSDQRIKNNFRKAIFSLESLSSEDTPESSESGVQNGGGRVLQYIGEIDQELGRIYAP